jgi:hypothetical protein
MTSVHTGYHKQPHEKNEIGSNICWVSIGQWFDMLVNICGKSPRDFRNETSNGLNDTGWGQETLDKLTIQLSKVGNSLPQFSDTYRLGFSCSFSFLVNEAIASSVSFETSSVIFFLYG